MKTGKAKNEMQKILAVQIYRAIMQRQYSQIAMFLEMLAKSIGDDENVDRVHQIKQNCSIDFENFCILYLKSFVMPSYRGIRFLSTGRKMVWPQVRQLAMAEFVLPLNDVAIKLIAKISETSGTILKTYMESIRQVTNDATDIDAVSKGPEIVFDV